MLGLPLILISCGPKEQAPKATQEEAAEQPEQTAQAEEGALEAEEEAEQHGEGAGHSHEKAAQHGGVVAMTEKHHFEIVFHGDEVKVYGYDKQQNRIPLESVSGKVLLRTKEGKAQETPLKYYSDDSGKGYLEAEIEGISEYEAGSAKLTFTLSGLAGPESTVSFTESYKPHEEGEGHHGHHE